MDSWYRSLAASEQAFAGRFPTVCSLEVVLTGHLDVSRLTAAFGALRQRHHALAARVATTAAGAQRFCAGDTGSASEDFVSVHDGAGWSSTTGPSLDIARSLSALSVVTGRTRQHRVTLHIGHVLADGTYAISMLAELFRTYTDTDDTTPAEPASFPMSADDFLSDHPIAGATRREQDDPDPLIGTRWHGTAITPVRDQSPRWPVVRSLRFDPDTTARLLAALRREQVGVFAAVTGTIACAERIGFAEGPDRDSAVPLGVMTMVDLRRRVSPTVGPTEVTNFVAPSFHAVSVSPGHHPVPVGEAIARRVADDIDSGRLLAELAETESGRSRHPRRHPPVVISNLGAIPDLTLPPGLTAVDVRPALWFDCSGLVLSDPDSAGRPAPVATTYQISTYAGRLGVEMINLPGTVSPGTQAAIARSIDGRLRSWADGAPVRPRSPAPHSDTTPEVVLV